MNLEERLESPQETFNSSEASGKCSSLLLVCGACLFSSPGLEPPSGAAGRISVDRHVVGPVSCFHLHQPGSAVHWPSLLQIIIINHTIKGSTCIRHRRKCWASSYVYKYTMFPACTSLLHLVYVYISLQLWECLRLSTIYSYLYFGCFFPCW